MGALWLLGILTRKTPRQPRGKLTGLRVTRSSRGASAPTDASDGLAADQRIIPPIQIGRPTTFDVHLGMNRGWAWPRRSSRKPTISLRRSRHAPSLRYGPRVSSTMRHMRDGPVGVMARKQTPTDAVYRGSGVASTECDSAARMTARARLCMGEAPIREAGGQLGCSRQKRPQRRQRSATHRSSAASGPACPPLGLVPSCS